MIKSILFIYNQSWTSAGFALFLVFSRASVEGDECRRRSKEPCKYLVYTWYIYTSFCGLRRPAQEAIPKAHDTQMFVKLKKVT